MDVINFMFVFCIEIPVSSVDPDQTLHFAASYLRQHCLHFQSQK